jgi:hypothetical protein
MGNPSKYRNSATEAGKLLRDQHDSARTRGRYQVFRTGADALGMQSIGLGGVNGGTNIAQHCSMPELRPSAKARTLWLLAAALWVGALGFGLDAVRRYESTPGQVGLTPPLWPAVSHIRPDPNRATLIMLVHPQCSCTRASLDELNAVMNRVQGRAAAWILFVKPTGVEGGWERTATWSEAKRIPGVTVLTDPDGVEATRFGALTSGHVVLYDRTGHLMFSGGITGARGHEGDNSGQQSLLAFLSEGTAQGHRHAVYGCAL